MLVQSFKRFSQVIQKSKNISQELNYASIYNFHNLKHQNKQLSNGAIQMKLIRNFSVQDKSKTQELKQLSDMMGMKQQKINEEIPNKGDIRLVGDNGKQIGLYTLEQALKMANSKGVDLLLVSDSVKPMICKMVNYKDLLYKKFINEFLLQDAKQNKKTKKSEKKVQLSTNISMGDLKNKATQTVEFAKKFEKFTVFMLCNEKNIENSKNLIYTFADMVKSDLSTELDDIKDQQVDMQYLDEKEVADEEDSSITRRIEMTFISNSYVSQSQNFSEEEIKKLINQYFSKTQRRISNKDILEGHRQIGQEILEEENAELRQQSMVGQEQYEDLDLNTLVEQQAKENDVNNFSEDLKQSMLEFQKKSNMSIEEMQQEVQNLKVKYSTDAQQAIVDDIINEQQKKIRDINRIARIVNIL
ncbi:Translation initiation factor 3, N-terminal [Pseudocohnilembus persalinus]|uniref:Translation initiation factor 3, N-terminal n=1 Tax=Pseudocohnilembus persalinus TaxID=266149 RepID=A0A0V0QBM5_PSEPJ|nr:Translation initiation factor 3, N-terminal [Pseudocohnilembus persalinus]|eukprot:KRW99608.1 Translation initiation factor 3, N-terminal [Pseudocohnilembus persalinus]